MIPDLAPLVTVMGDGVALYGAVFLRIGALILFLPGFGERSIPMRVRVALAFAFTAVVAPMVQTPIDLFSLGPWPLVIAVVQESFVGVLFGMLLRFFVHALQLAGTIAAQSTSLSQMFGGAAGVDAQPALSAILVLAGIALAVLLGLHVKVVQYALLTYELMPFGSVMSPDTLYVLGVEQISRCFALGFSLSAPFLIASLIYNVTLGFINKAMPQLMVAFIGAPAVTFAGIALMVVSAPLILNLWVQSLHMFMLNPGAAH